MAILPIPPPPSCRAACKCGNLLERDVTSPCRCSGPSVEKHFAAISGPLMDRMDIYVELFRVSSNTLSESIKESRSADSPEVRRRIMAAWERQYDRCRRHGVPPTLNSRIPSGMIARVFELSGAFEEFSDKAVERLWLSVRGYQRMIRVARTIADYEGSAQVAPAHLAQALQLRRKGR